jgi:hypothetical protein
MRQLATCGAGARTALEAAEKGIFSVHDLHDTRGDGAAINSDADGHAAASGRAGRAEAVGDGSPDTGSANTPTSAPQRAPLTARARLDIANRQLRAASDDLERHRQPVRRLRESINAVDAAERELDVHRQAHLTQQGQWLANGGRPDQRPAEPVELLKAEQRLVDAQRAGAAARAVIGDHEAALTAASRHVNAMTAARDEAYRDAIVAIAADYIDVRYLQAMRVARGHEKCIWDLHDSVADGRTAERITQLLRDAKAQLVTPIAEPRRGTAFLTALLADPAAAQLGP